MDISNLEKGPQNVSRTIDKDTAAFLMFKEALKRQGCRLTDEQFELIREIVSHAKPSIPIPVMKGKSLMIQPDPVMQAAGEKFYRDKLMQ